MFKPQGPMCQSCGMPLSRDEAGGGTEASGKKSQEYCSHCYQKGKFTAPDLTVEQMVARVKDKMREMKVPPLGIEILARDIPKLKRWQKK